LSTSTATHTPAATQAIARAPARPADDAIPSRPATPVHAAPAHSHHLDQAGTVAPPIPPSRPAASADHDTPHHKRSFMDRVDTFVSRLSTRNNFWHRVCSLIWMPYTFKSGIRMKRVGEKTFSAVLPFRRINRNWYNAMAGAALLANSEIAGGMYVFAECGGHYTVVCKNLEYRFLRPCYGPAIYRISPREDLQALIAAGGEFNITLDLEIIQQIAKGSKERRVGRCTATFHATPKVHQQRKGRKVRP
jgi:hypothetical protein